MSDGAHESAFAREEVRKFIEDTYNKVLVLSCYPWPLQGYSGQYFNKRYHKTCHWAWWDHASYAKRFSARNDMLLALAYWGVYDAMNNNLLATARRTTCLRRFSYKRCRICIAASSLVRECRIVSPNAWLLG